MTEVNIVVFGTAQPAGSKRAFMHPTLKRSMIVDANPKAAGWKDNVAQAAGEQFSGPLLVDPLSMTVVVYRPRPAGHYGTGKNAGVVKESAPPFPASRPDLLKLSRGIEDALSGVVYRDDSQIVDEFLLKRYGEPARVEICIRPVVDDVLYDATATEVLGARLLQAAPVGGDVQRALCAVPALW